MRLAYSRTEMVGFVRELLDAFEYQAKARGICLKLVPGQKGTVCVDRPWQF